MISSTLMTSERIATAEMACAAERTTISSLPLPRYWATTTVPPVATAMKTCSRKILSESTMLTALTAATPEVLTIAVLSRVRQTTKAWSTRMGMIRATMSRTAMPSPEK